MSANVYQIEGLLVGEYYRSRSLEGEIVSAQKDERAVWYEDCTPYIVEIRKPHGGYAYRTVVVKTENL
ncbi:hypothetical protein EBQ93_02955 [bacterium]|nr:hypothetical protein [bacterium]